MAGTEVGPQSSFFTNEMKRHLSDCHINFKKYKKLSRILGNIKKVSPNEDEMILKFTNKCYGNEKDRKKAREQAKHFLDTLFGSCAQLFRLGPNAALEQHVIHAVEAFKKSKEPVTMAELLPNVATSNVSGWDGSTDKSVLGSEDARGTLWTRKMEHYLIGPTLGVGGTAKVKLGLDTKNDNKVVAIKILKPRYAKDAGREIETLRELNHSNVIRLYGEYNNVKFGRNDPTSVFILEYASSGELIEYLMYTGKFQSKLARWMFQNLVEGVEYVHGKGFCHRDLKHDNCLLGEGFTLKITDFGFAAKIGVCNDCSGDKCTCHNKMKTAIGTEQYAAPEILKHKKYGKAVDIFAMGVMLFIALAGCQPFMRADQRDRWYSLIIKGDWSAFWKYHMARAHKFDKNSISLLQKMLAPQPQKRLTIAKIKKHRWFANDQVFTQAEAAAELQMRKNTVDKEKWSSGDPSAAKTNRDIKEDIPCAPMFWAKRPRSSFWFFSDTSAHSIQENLVNFVSNSTADKGMGGQVMLRKVVEEDDDDNFNLGEHLLSAEENGDFTDEEFMTDGVASPFNVKFHVNITMPTKGKDEKEDKGKDIYGIWRIYCQKMDGKQMAEMARKKKEILDVEAKFKAMIDEAKEDDAKAKAEDLREEAFDKLEWEDRKPFMTDKDRLRMKLYNIVLFTPWRPPSGKVKKIKTADGVKINVRRRNYIKEYFPQVYKVILTEFAASFMVLDEDDTKASSQS